MTEIYAMTPGHRYWESTISLAERCSWRAGPYLAEKMNRHEFADWERVFAACVNGEVAGFCTLAVKDELPPEHAFTPFIGFVFVDERFRGNRLSESLVNSATSYARELGYKQVYILSGEVGLYEKYGFEKLGDYETVYGSIDQLFVKPTS